MPKFVTSIGPLTQQKKNTMRSTSKQKSVTEDKHSAQDSQQSLHSSSEEKLQILHSTFIVAVLIVFLYLASFIIVAIVGLVTKNFLLLGCLPIMARELHYMLRKAIDRLFP